MKKTAFLCCMLLSLWMAVSAAADTIDIGIPNDTLSFYPGPYATLEVILTDATHATIKMTALNDYAIGGNKAFDLNTNDAVNFSNLTDGFSDATSPNPPQNDVSEFGRFNLIFDGGSGFSDPYDEVSVTLVSSGGWASVSDVLTPNDKGYIAAGHFGVLLVDSGYVDTGFAGAGAGDGTPVPEPATMFLLGSGLIGVGVFVRSRLKK